MEQKQKEKLSELYPWLSKRHFKIVEGLYDAYQLLEMAGRENMTARDLEGYLGGRT